MFRCLEKGMLTVLLDMLIQGLWRAGTPATTISLPSHVILIFSSDPSQLKVFILILFLWNIDFLIPKFWKNYVCWRKLEMWLGGRNIVACLPSLVDNISTNSLIFLWIKLILHCTIFAALNIKINIVLSLIYKFLGSW